MEKLTLNISPEDWGSLVTKYKPDAKKLTLANFTDGTINADTDVTGNITKRKGGPTYNPTALSAAPKDQFEAIFADGARHLLVAANGEIRYSSGDSIFNTVVNGTGFSTGANFEFATTQDRVYGGNGVDSPIVYDRTTSYGGVSYSAPRIKTMGAQAPSSAPTAGAPTAGGNVPNGAHTYKITFLYYDFEESNGGPASGVQTAGAGNNTIPLTSIPVGGYGVTARKIYRDNNDGLWLHIATLANNTATTFSDTISVGTTPTEIPEFNDVPPTFGLIVTWLDREWLGKVPGDPFTLFYTETSMPDIVRPENQVLCNQEDPITAYIVYFGRLVVFNRRSMGQILGTTSDTFRYSSIPSSVGCVDNRTLQIRVIEGVPILIWLSDRGFYSYDGNRIDYISEEIEDLVNFNIQQATQQKNSNTQSSQTQFSGGTASQGIDLSSVPGSITTKGYLNGTSMAGTNPRRNFDDSADWEGGLDKQNVITTAADNLLKNPTRFAPALADGILSSAIIDGTNLKMSLASDFTGDSASTTRRLVATTIGEEVVGYAYPLIVPRSATLNTITMPAFGMLGGTIGNTYQYRLKVWNDSGNSPGSVRAQSATQSVVAGAFGIANISGDVFASIGSTLTGGTRYWIGVEIVTPGIFFFAISFGGFGNGTTKANRSTSGWTASTDVHGASLGSGGTVSYDVCTHAVAKTGQWLSPIHDTESSYITTTLQIIHTGSYTGGSFCSGAYAVSALTRLEGSNNATFSGGAEVSEDFSNVNGTQSYTLSGKRYWRIRITLSTTDDRATPTVGTPILKFNQTGTWVSALVDTTADVTSYDSLVISSSTPAGTSVTITVASSANGTTFPDGFVAFGSVVVRRYIKIQAVLSSTSDNVTSPTISSIILRWTLTSNLISSAIDTAVTPPAGWDIFLSSYQTNGGTVQFQMRSATSSGGLTAATFYTVTPGDFPSSVTPLQFVQWKVIITSSDEEVPEVDSVTVQWFISIVASIRPASIFVDSRYYVALALLDETENTVLLEFDLHGKWRRHSGLSISTFSFFFNRPYLGLATSGYLRKFLEGLTDNGSAIEFDVRFKASDFSTQYQNNSSKVKLVGEVVLEGTNTGAAIQMFYSVDNGETFQAMYTPDGLTTYTTSSDESNFYVRFRPKWDGSVPFSGRTIMYRIYSNDTSAVEISGLEGTAFLRLQAPVVTG